MRVSLKSSRVQSAIRRLPHRLRVVLMNTFFATHARKESASVQSVEEKLAKLATANWTKSQNY